MEKDREIAQLEDALTHEQQRGQLAQQSSQAEAEKAELLAGRISEQAEQADQVLAAAEAEIQQLKDELGGSHAEIGQLVGELTALQFEHASAVTEMTASRDELQAKIQAHEQLILAQKQRALVLENKHEKAMKSTGKRGGLQTTKNRRGGSKVRT